ncbi:MAG: 4Fe-4S binding protein, partial [Deltaproteobacteria bacterium]|nr:4Fe-4S binding protein [Deltaproteobacteria bacterium]
CNPCETSCDFDAIIVGEDITNIPHLDGDKCVACQTCVYICPGQAIFMIDESLPEGKASVMMPYEYRPLPEREMSSRPWIGPDRNWEMQK